jgi:hypothetical protein
MVDGESDKFEVVGSLPASPTKSPLSIRGDAVVL